MATNNRRNTEGEDTPNKPPNTKATRRAGPAQKIVANTKQETVAKHPPKSTTIAAKHKGMAAKHPPSSK